MFKVGYEESANDGYSDFEIIHAVFDTNEQATEYCEKYNNQSKAISKLIQYVREVVDKEAYVYAEGQILNHVIQKDIQAVSSLKKLHKESEDKRYSICKEHKNDKHPEAIQQKLISDLLFKELCEKKKKVEREESVVIEQYKRRFKDTELALSVLNESERKVWLNMNQYENRHYLIVLGEVEHNPIVEEI